MKKIQRIFNKIRRHYELTADLENRIRREIRIVQLQNLNVSFNETGITDEKHCEQEVIVSLTTHGNRIYEVYLAIESLMHQTIKPNKIILWLADDEFTIENIPQTLKNLLQKGLTIEFCKDIKSYQKLVPALRIYSEDIIITVDDDMLYPYDMVENLLCAYRQHPYLIHFCRGHRLKFKKDSSLENYNNWEFCIQDRQVNKFNFPTGVGGVLYPPRCLHKDVTDEKLFMELAPWADDVWFYAMALLNGTRSKKCFTHSANGEDYIELNSEIQTETALYKSNVLENGNDKQIKQVFEKYDLYKLLK